MLCLFSGVWLQESCARHTIDAAGRQALRLRHQRTQSQGLCYLCEYTKTPSTFSLLPLLLPLSLLVPLSFVCLASSRTSFCGYDNASFWKDFQQKVSNEALCVQVCVCPGVCRCVHVCACVDFRSQSWKMHTQSNAYDLFTSMNCIEQGSTLSRLLLPLSTSTLYKLYNSCCCTCLVVKIVISVCSSCSSNPKAACNAYKSHTSGAQLTPPSLPH